MENEAKLRICEVLGVEVGERFIADYPYKDLGKMEVREDGSVACGTGKVRSNVLCYMINHPECVRRIPRWTPKEVELAKAIKLVFPDSYSLFRVCVFPKDWIRIVKKDRSSLSFTIEGFRFPSLKPVEAVLLSDIIGEEHGAAQV